jgi:thymidine kinase
VKVEHLVQDHIVKRDELSAKKLHTEKASLLKSYGNAVRQLTDPYDEIASELELITGNPCRENTYLWIIAAQIHPSPRYLDSLCRILEQDNACIWHEGIVDILYDLADERSVPSLEKALSYEYRSDPTRELAIKILATLDEIGTPEALDIVRRCLQSSSERIREEAKLLLEDEDEI